MEEVIGENICTQSTKDEFSSHIYGAKKNSKTGEISKKYEIFNIGCLRKQAVFLVLE
jgi:hypothetical protein